MFFDATDLTTATSTPPHEHAGSTQALDSMDTNETPQQTPSEIDQFFTNTWHLICNRFGSSLRDAALSLEIARFSQYVQARYRSPLLRC
mgnify:FL=1